MLVRTLFILTLFSFVSAQFFNPPEGSRGRQVWRIGEVQTIEYNTSFSKYTIALWQQAPAGGSASLGPILFQTTKRPESSFDWIVQAYEFNLTISNVFFLWLIEGDASMQGNQSSPGMSSSYFNLTAAAAVAPSSSAMPESASTTSTAQPTATSDAQGGKESDIPASSGGLSTGAQAGIGVGVGIVGLAAIVSAVLWFRYLQNKQKILLAKLEQRQPYEPQSLKSASPVTTRYYPAEMASLGSTRVVELG